LIADVDRHSNQPCVRVRTDAGSLESHGIKVEIFQVWKNMENDLKYGKVMESVTTDLKN